MAGDSGRQGGVPDRREKGKGIRRGGNSTRGGAGTSGGNERGRQSARSGSGERHYSEYARSSGHPRPGININQVPPASSAYQEDEEVDPVEEEIEEEEVEQDDDDEKDYSSIIEQAEEYQRQPGREGLRWLDPIRPRNTLWFVDNEVAGNVTNCIKSYYKSPITSWSRGDMKHYTHWFLAFAQKYNWQPSITFTVWAVFKEKAILRLKDNTCTLKSKYGMVGDKARPSWISPRVWTGMKEYWGRTTTISRSMKSSVSRSKNTSKHTSGQISFGKRQILEADEDGNIPPLYKIYDKVHRRKDGTYITSESEQLVTLTQQRIDELSMQMSPGGSSVASTNVLPISEQDAIFTQVAPKNKRGQVVGLGSIQNPSLNCRSGTTQFPGYVSQEAWEQSQATIKALEDKFESREATFQASIQSMQDQMAEMRQMFLQQSQGYRPMPPPSYHQGHENVGPSSAPQDQDINLSDDNMNITFDPDFEFPDINRGEP